MPNPWMAICPQVECTRILAKQGRETILKARLDSSPGHPRALPWLLEALALWQGGTTHAALCVDGLGSGYGARFCRDSFDLFDSSLFRLEWLEAHQRGDGGGDDLGFGADFRDLDQLHVDLLLSRGSR